MDGLQSAAFTFLAPAGCAYDPADRGGLSGFTCEMALRGAGPRDSRQFILDLDNLGVERAESVSSTHTSYSGATLAENLPAALAIYADLLRRPHLPAGPIGGRPAGHAAGASGGGGRAVAEGDDRAAAAALSRPVGPAHAGRPEGAGGDGHRRHPPPLRPLLSPQRHDPRRCRPGGLAAAEGPGGRTVRRLDARRRRRASASPRPASATSTCTTIRTRRRSASRFPACPTGIAIIFRPGARWAC